MTIEQIQSCRLLAFSVRKSVRGMRLSRGSPVMMSCQIAHLRAKFFSWLLAQGVRDVKHRVSPGVSTQGLNRSFFFPCNLARFPHCDRKMICLISDRQNNLGEELDLFSCRFRFRPCVIFVSRDRVNFRKINLVTERLLRRAKTAVEDKHWYSLTISTTVVWTDVAGDLDEISFSVWSSTSASVISEPSNASF